MQLRPDHLIRVLGSEGQLPLFFGSECWHPLGAAGLHFAVWGCRRARALYFRISLGAPVHRSSDRYVGGPSTFRFKMNIVPSMLISICSYDSNMLLGVCGYGERYVCESLCGVFYSTVDNSAALFHLCLSGSVRIARHLDSYGFPRMFSVCPGCLSNFMR